MRLMSKLSFPCSQIEFSEVVQEVFKGITRLQVGVSRNSKLMFTGSVRLR